MKTSDFKFVLPPELIAQTPANPRDSSRLLVVNRQAKKLTHRVFSDLVDYLGPNDLVVWNNSKVFKARLKGSLALNEATDGIPDEAEAKLRVTDVILPRTVIEIFLIRPTENEGVWKVLAKPGRKLRLGYKIIFGPDFSCVVIAKDRDGTVAVQFAYDAATVRDKANLYGSVPTPPYIKTSALAGDYQTTYAKNEGSVAAPTAGFHFTPELIEKLKTKGVTFAEITLHVGLGTFLPVKTAVVEDHKMHSEWVEISPETANQINLAKATGKRIVAVGTTTVRTLESVAALHQGQVAPFSGDINIFITPGYKFQVVEALITNFHLPESTLLMLVSAFVEDTAFMLRCYEEAVKEKYRFFSFGDAMFIE